MVKHWFTGILFSVIVLVFSQTAFSQIDFCDKICDIANDEANQNEWKLDETVDAVTDNYDLKYLNIHWEVIPTTGFIKGAINYYFKTISDINKIEFDCSHVLVIDSIHFHQSSLTTFSQSEKVLTINFPFTINSDFDSIEVFYHGTPQSSGLGSYTLSSHLGDSIVCTLSEPYGSRDWWPSKMSLKYKTDSADIFITTPVNYKAGCNGLLIKADTSGSDVTYHWQTKYPIATYLFGIAIYPYDEITYKLLLPPDTLLVQNYVYPDEVNNFQEFIPVLDSVLGIYSYYFGTYPFIKEKYGHAYWNSNGGMEHQTMSFVGNSGFDLISHELAHQWFGDKITCGSWQDIWLNEGFATYSTGICYQILDGGYWWMPYKITQLSHVIADSSGSVFCTDTTDVHRIFNPSLSYSKGAYLLHMLRWKMGDTKFFKAIKNYITDTSLVYKFSRTENLKQHLEEVYGENLDEYFNEWFYGKGFPTYQLYWTQQHDTVVTRLYQTQTDASVSFFHIPVPVTFYGNGTDTTFVYDPQQSGDEYTFMLPFTIDSIKIDPELHIISGHNEVIKKEYLTNFDEIVIYPNPASEFINIEHMLNDESISEIKLFNDLGQLIGEWNDLNIAALKKFSIPVNALTHGVYILDITGEKSNYRRRFVKL